MQLNEGKIFFTIAIDLGKTLKYTTLKYIGLQTEQKTSCFGLQMSWERMSHYNAWWNNYNFKLYSNFTGEHELTVRTNSPALNLPDLLSDAWCLRTTLQNLSIIACLIMLLVQRLFTDCPCLLLRKFSNKQRTVPIDHIPLSKLKNKNWLKTPWFLII